MTDRQDILGTTNSMDNLYNTCPWSPTVAIFVAIIFLGALWHTFRWRLKFKRNLFGPDAPVAEPMLVAVAVGGALAAGLVSFYKSACLNRTQGVCEMVVRVPPWLLLSGVVAAPAVLLTWYWSTSHKQADMMTGRFAAAVELLGSEKLAVRIGAIYALERIALDSSRDQKGILETLSAFVREGATGLNGVVAADVLAALVVLGRLPRKEDETFSLRGAQAMGARLAHAHLDGVDLTDANLNGATLQGASLAGASLAGASLLDTMLDGANLKGTLYNSSTKFPATWDAAEPERRGLAKKRSDSPRSGSARTRVGGFLPAGRPASPGKDAVASDGRQRSDSSQLPRGRAASACVDRQNQRAYLRRSPCHFASSPGTSTN